MGLNNIDLVAFAKTKLGTAYVYGAKGKVLTQANYNYLKSTYPKYVPNSDEKKVGKVCVDCSGLISMYTGILKGSTQFKNESDAQPISTIASAPVGVAVWRQGHIGIYIGNGEIIEAMGSAYGTVKTKVINRDFTHWFRLNDIEYITQKKEADEVVTTEKVIVNGKEEIVTLIRKDGTTYIKARDIGTLLGHEVTAQGKVPVFTKK